MNRIKEALIDFNPWWKGNFSVEYKEREIYKKIKKFLTLPQIIAFTGLRRVGKTTLMFKIVEDYIKNGIKPENIIYFSFDEFKEIKIKDIMKEYDTLFGNRKGKILLLLDEIQKMKNWENQLKTFYDLNKRKVKIIISGSESLFIRKFSKETLAGRLFEFKIEPLTFKEFIHFIKAKHTPIDIYERELIKLFNKFILIQGFPELVGIEDKEIIKKYIKESIVEKVIYKDITQLFKIKDISVLEYLLNIFMEDPGQLIEVSDLSKEMNITRQTLSQYISYLESSYLLRKLYNFSKSRRKVERKLKKYYPAILSVDLTFRKDHLSQSRAFECTLVNQLNAEFFWRDAYKNEVDVILSNKTIKPIEIKYGKIKLDSLLTFMKKFNIKNGYIISYEKEGENKINGKNIHIIPAFKFLLKFL